MVTIQCCGDNVSLIKPWWCQPLPWYHHTNTLQHIYSTQLTPLPTIMSEEYVLVLPGITSSRVVGSCCDVSVVVVVSHWVLSGWAEVFDCVLVADQTDGWVVLTDCTGSWGRRGTVGQPQQPHCRHCLALLVQYWYCWTIFTTSPPYLLTTAMLTS